MQTTYIAQNQTQEAIYVMKMTTYCHCAPSPVIASPDYIGAKQSPVSVIASPNASPPVIASPSDEGRGNLIRGILRTDLKGLSAYRFLIKFGGKKLHEHKNN